MIIPSPRLCAELYQCSTSLLVKLGQKFPNCFIPSSIILKIFSKRQPLREQQKLILTNFNLENNLSSLALETEIIISLLLKNMKNKLLISEAIVSRCSSRQVFFKNFTVFTEKYLYWNLFLIKLQACSFIEKRLRHWCFPVNIAKLLRTGFLQNTFSGCFYKLKKLS